MNRMHNYQMFTVLSLRRSYFECSPSPFDELQYCQVADLQTKPTNMGHEAAIVYIHYHHSVLFSQKPDTYSIIL